MVHTSQKTEWTSYVTVVVALIGIILALKAHDYIGTYEKTLKNPRSSDIYAVSYPKSGNNWLRFLLGHLYLYGKGNWKSLDFHSIEDVVPDLEYGTVRKVFENLGAPRIFKSHQPFHKGAKVPCEVVVGEMETHQCMCPNCPEHWTRALVLIRDGRDVMCSYYHFQKKLHIFNGSTFEEFLRVQKYPGYDWADHVKSFLDHQNDEGKDFFFVKYEDLQENPHETLLQVATWANLPNSTEAIDWALQRSSFQEMRQQEEAKGLRLFDKHYSDRQNEFRLTRKGKVGSWDECFTSQESKNIFNKHSADVLYQLGYIKSLNW